MSCSLTPQAALLVPTDPIDPMVDRRGFTGSAKRPPVKADLPIYSLIIVGISGRWANVVTMLNNKMDFYCCDNSVGFCKSSHI